MRSPTPSLFPHSRASRRWTTLNITPFLHEYSIYNGNNYGQKSGQLSRRVQGRRRRMAVAPKNAIVAALAWVVFSLTVVVSCGTIEALGTGVENFSDDGRLFKTSALVEKPLLSSGGQSGSAVANSIQWAGAGDGERDLGAGGLLGDSEKDKSGLKENIHAEEDTAAAPTAVNHDAVSPVTRVTRVLEEFPSPEDSKILFMHVFKCAGSTLRRMLVEWAEEEGETGAVVSRCEGGKPREGRICMRHEHVLDYPEIQEGTIAQRKVLAGHFLWGFQDHIHTPYLLVTALRNPLEVFVSGQQFMHRKQTKTLETATSFVSGIMEHRLARYMGDRPYHQFTGFIFRFVGPEIHGAQGAELEAATERALLNMDKFWLIGVVEQFAGFSEVLQRLLDPTSKHRALWDHYLRTKYNTSTVKTADILASMPPYLVQHFNESIALQWRLYEKAVDLWDVRCREVLPTELQAEMCGVRSPATAYILPNATNLSTDDFIN